MGRSLADHADGSWFVDLAALAPSAPAAVDSALAGTLAAAVGVDVVAGQPAAAVVDAVVDHLRPLHAILVVDTCGHVLGPAAALVESLLRACPQLWVVATSREPLGVPGEVVWRVLPLSTPAEPPSSIDGLLEYEAPRLFVERCRALVADQELTDADAAAVARICVRLDGLPLAIELAAACTAALSVEQIALRLDDRFRLLTLGSRTAPARHQSLLRSVQWSYDLLPSRHQALLCQLSVLAGSFSLEEAEDVGAGSGPGPGSLAPLDRGDVVDVLIGLVNASLVVSDSTGSHACYRLLETIRHFARDRLVELEQA